MAKPPIYVKDDSGKLRSLDPKQRGALFVVFFLLLAFLMGLAGSILGFLTLSTNSTLREKLGIKPDSELNITTTKQEKLRLEESSAIIDAVKKVSPAVVSIATSKNVKDLFGNIAERKGGGTGFLITNDGLILTNKHVVDDPSAKIQVFLADARDFEAEVLAKDPFQDLAVLRIDAKGLPTVELGDSDKMQVGQWVIAIGNALGELENTVTVGVVSARERQITAESERLEGLLQTDAAINPGNSGGPLVNLRGQVVGLNTAIVGGAQNIGFAIPINVAKNAIQSVQKTGKIIRPFIGIRYIPITKEIAKAADLPVDYGVLVRSSDDTPAVVAGSPAEKAGIQENDIVLEINDERIDEENTLGKIMQRYTVGDEVELKVRRGSQDIKITLKLGEIS